MKLGRTCLAWLVVYVLIAGGLAAIAYRRLPLPAAAAGASLVGGFVGWMGVG